MKKSKTGCKAYEQPTCETQVCRMLQLKRHISFTFTLIKFCLNQEGLVKAPLSGDLTWEHQLSETPMVMVGGVQVEAPSCFLDIVVLGNLPGYFELHCHWLGGGLSAEGSEAESVGHQMATC